jgi:pimeloyl-ACP methyl ester carboxylesterase
VILPGGHGDADIADALCDQLVDRYTVVTYDRRGQSRSKSDAAVDELTLSTHSEDTCRLLLALSKEPVLVFGSSIGALIGLDLMARHPAQVQLLVAHEPAAWDILPKAEQDLTMRAQEDVEATFRKEGAGAALKKLAVLAGVAYEDREPDITVPTTPHTPANLSFFFSHDSPAIRRYRLDVEALKARATRIVLGYGQSTPANAPHRAAVALGARLGVRGVEFPGGHTGWLLRPKAFATRLREVLG